MSTMVMNASGRAITEDTYDPVIRSYRYGMAAAPTILLCILVLAGLVPVYYFAFFDSGDRLSPLARLLFQFFACLSPIGLIGLGVGAFHNLFRPQRLAFTENAIIYPDARGGFSEKEGYLPYAEITDIREVQHAGELPSIEVIAPSHDLTIRKAMLQKEGQFEKILSLLYTQTALHESVEPDERIEP